MILLLNIIVPLVIILLVYVAWRLKNPHPAWLAIVFVIGYGFLQPSYMPKGTVKPMSTPIEFQQVEGPMTDRLMKPKSAEQYDLERKAALKAIDKSIREQILKQSKSTEDQK